MRRFTVLVLALGLVACKRSDDKPSPSTGSQGVSVGSGSGAPARPRIEQIAPPIPVQTPPADATKTASGLIYKKITPNDAGLQPKRNDVVLINYTGWREATGETFFTNRGKGKPMRMGLTQAAPGFTEALQLMHKGETAMLWMPPSIGYKVQPSKPETLVYQLEIVDVLPAPAVPDDVAKPPATATALPSGIKRTTLAPGTGKTKARQFDNVTFNYTVWDAAGKMLDTTTARDRALTIAPYKETALGQMITTMTEGEHARFWADTELTKGGRAIPGAQGVLCFDVEVQKIAKAEHEPPPVPPDVAKPPADAKKSSKGVFYRVLKSGPGKPHHPGPDDTVRVHYTGWTTDGRMFDSSVLRGDKSTFSLKSVVSGWTDGIPLMSVGDVFRFWIPEELAYKGAAGKPKGMLVFEVELFEILPPAATTH